MDIEIRPAEGLDNVTVAAVTGRIDSYTLERVTEEIGSLIRIGSCRIVCDLSGVDFVAGVGLKAFLKAIRDARNAGGDFLLCGLQPPVEKIFNLAGFTDIAEIHPTREAALVAFGAPPPADAYGATMVAGPGGDPYGQTMVAPQNGADPYGRTLIASPGADEANRATVKETVKDRTPDSPASGPGRGFDATLIDKPDAPGRGFDATLIERPDPAGENDSGEEDAFAKTLLDPPEAAKPDPMAELREKLRTAAGTPGKKPASTDATEKLKAKLRAAAGGQAPSGKPDTKAFQTVMTRIEEIEGTLIEPADAPPVPDRPVLEPIRVTIPAAAAHVEGVSRLVGAAGEIAGVAKMDLVRLGVAVTEVLRAVVLHAPDATLVACEIQTEAGAVRVRIRPDGGPFDLYAILRPRMESSINDPAAAEAWLSKLVTRATVGDVDGCTQVVLEYGPASA